MAQEHLTETHEQMPDIALTEMAELEDHPLFGREYELTGPIEVAGKQVAFSGSVINHGDGASLGLDPDGLIMRDAKERFDDPTLTPDKVYQWTVTVESKNTQPLEDGLFPTSYMTHNLDEGADEAARSVVGWAVDVYRKEDQQERVVG